MDNLENIFSEKKYFLIRYASPMCILILGLILLFLKWAKVGDTSILERVINFYMQ